MSQIQSWIIVFACLLGLTAFCSYIGDDDVIYLYLYRKPSPREGIVRVRWVLLKTFTSLYGGLASAPAVIRILEDCCSISLSKDSIALIAFGFMALASLLIGILQNGIRWLRGRPRRPIIDRVVWQRSAAGPLERDR